MDLRGEVVRCGRQAGIFDSDGGNRSEEPAVRVRNSDRFTRVKAVAPSTGKIRCFPQGHRHCRFGGIRTKGPTEGVRSDISQGFRMRLGHTGGNYTKTGMSDSLVVHIKRSCQPRGYAGRVR